MLWTVSCFFLFGSLMNFVTADDRCRTEVNIPGMALKGFVFKKMSVTAPYKCDVKCEREINCQSYNYVSEENLCELNNRTKEARPENFRSDPARFYIRRLNGRAPLGSIPELPAQLCQEIKASEGKDTISSKYWLDPTGTGKAVLVYCDMKLEDIDECITGNHDCHVNANCTNTVGGHNCTCKEGYTGDGRSCSDIDECSNGSHKCNVNANCTNTIGGHNCTCKEGYVGDGRSCSDIDECNNDSHKCDVNANCTNTVGGHNCTCKEGYTGDGRSCADIDECITGNHDCDVNANCTNTVGGHNCTCKEGFTGDGRSCSDIDECSNGNHKCDVNANCTNTVGGYNCTCKEGFNGNGSSCSDIDKCSNGSHKCDVNANCTNTVGGHNCTCKEGYTGDGRSCSDIDECITGNHDCDVNANCTNTVGGHNCTCKEGFYGNGSSCSDIDECSNGSHTCDENANCTNTFGGHNCTCKERFYGNGSSCSALKNCADIYKSGERKDGVYTIKPDNLPAFDVFCDQTTAGGGWTVFQKRQDGSVDFFLYWSDYKNGFGNLSGEFWLGLEEIYHLTTDNGNMLRIDMADFEGNTAYAEYNMFGVMSENDKYELILGNYSGTAGDSLSYHRGQLFSTQDQDNDNHGVYQCARLHPGAWWYNSCHDSNLNGIYRHINPSPSSDGVNWYAWKGKEYSLKRTEMKIRPVDF
ncbi:uncharacterized protein LOC144649152 [Oculina patagonica]